MFELPLVSSVISECDRVIGTKRPDWDYMIIGMQNGQRQNTCLAGDVGNQLLFEILKS